MFYPRFLHAAIGLFVSTTAFAASIDPGAYTASVAEGQTVTVQRTVTLDAAGPAADLVDVFFLADNTGSMGGTLNAVRADAQAILDAISGGDARFSGIDVAFGVGRHYGDPLEYGSPDAGARAYGLQQRITNTTGQVRAAIDDWRATGGGDAPEANFFALHQVATQGASTDGEGATDHGIATGQITGWRPGAARVVVWFGDVNSHTTTVNRAEAIDALEEAGVVVAAINTRGGGSGIDGGGQASAIVEATAGTLSNNVRGAEATTNAILNAVDAATATVDLELATRGDTDGVDVTFQCTSPQGCEDVPPGERRTFDMQVAGSARGTYVFETYVPRVADTFAEDAVTVRACVSGLYARAKNSKVQLVWSDSGADHYTVYRSASAGGPYTRIADTTSRYSTYLDTGLDNGTTYHYVVREADASGNEFCQSVEASATPITLRERPRPINQPPAITSTPPTGATQGVTYVYPVEGVDPNSGDTLSYSLVEGPAGMSVNATTGRIEWTPVNASVGERSVAVRVEDPAGLMATQVWTISVANVNDPPRITSSPAVRARVDEPYVYAASAVDVDAGDALSWSLPAAPAGMDIDPDSGRIDWLPAPEQAGSRNVRVQVTDTAGATDTQDFLVEVATVNRAPEITSAPVQSATTGATYRYYVEASDPDPSDSLSFTLLTGPAGMSMDANAGLLEWNPGAGDAGTYTVEIQVEDAGGLTDTQGYELVVGAPNAAPEIASTPVATATVGQPYRYEVVATDADTGDTLTSSLPAAPAGMAVDPGTGVIEWTPGPDQVGEAGVVVEVRDPDGASASQNYIVAVAAANQAPSITSSPVTEAIEGSPYRYAPTASDPDAGDTLSYALDAAPSGMRIDPASGLVEWTPTRDQVGAQAVALRVRDGDGLADTQSYTVNVALSQRPPAFVSTPVPGATVDTTYTYNAEAEDPNGDALSYTLTEAPAGMSVDPDTGAVQWTPDAAQEEGANPVTLEVSDTTGLTARQSYSISVSPPENTSPEITSSPVTEATVGEPYRYDVAADDPDAGDSLSFTLDAAPTGMTIDASSGRIAWTPAEGHAGTASVSVRVVDGAGGTDTQSFAISVSEAENRPPQITSAPVTSAAVGEPYAYGVVASDPDGDTLTFDLLGGPSGMSIGLDSGGIEWLPRASQTGPNAVTVQVSDGSATAEQGFTVMVADDSDDLPLDVSISLSASVVDPNDPVTVTVTPRGGEGTPTLSLALEGAPVVLDAANQAVVSRSAVGAYELLATASDGDETVDARAIFTVRDPDDIDAPVARIDTPEDGAEITAPTEIIGTASDDNLAEYRLLLTPADGGEPEEIARARREVNGSVLGTFDPSQYANGLYDLTLVVRDVNGAQSTASAAYSVTGDLKVGNFSFTVEDLSVPVAGIPISVRRTYDTRRKQQSLDFGHGWSIDYQDVRIQENRTPGLNWEQTSTGGLIPTYCIEPVGPHYVTVTLPDGEVETFDMGVTPACQQLSPPRFVQPTYTARPGTDATLEPVSAEDVQFNAGQLLDLDTGVAFDPARYRLTTREGVVYLLDQGFGVRSVTEPNGNTVTFSNSGITHSAGVGIQFTRDGEGRITEVTDPEGRTISYRYDANGDLAEVTDREGNVTRHRYDRRHALTEYIDALGFTPARNLYDDTGRLVATVDAEGNRVELTHDIEGRREIVRDRRGNTTVMTYDDSGNVLSETDPRGNTTTYTYDADGNETSQTDPLGRTTSRTYNEYGQVLTTTDALGRTVSRTYDSSGRETVLTDAKGNTYTRAYDGAGNLTRVTDALGSTRASEFDAAGNVKRMTDVLGNTTVYSYDAAGNVTSRTGPLGDTESHTYDANGNRLSTSRARTSATGTVTVTTRREYDANGRVVARVDGAGNRRESVYDGNGKVIEEIDARGNRTRHEYDSRGNRIRTIHPDGNAERSDYDASGNLVAETDRAGRLTRHEYDALDQRVRTIHPDGAETRNEYDAAGQLVRSIDANGNDTRYEFDAAGNRTRMVDALGNATEYSYDTNGNRVSVTGPAGETTRFEYDALDRRVRTLHPDGTETRTEYDAAGRRVSETDQNGITTRFEYDARGQLTRVTDAAGGQSVYAYDELGNSLTQTDAEGRTTRWRYDNRGLVNRRTLPGGQSETFAYDANSNRVSHTDFNGATTTSEYDAEDRLVRRNFADGRVRTYTYTATGRIATVNGANGTTRYQYDQRDRITRIDTANGAYLAYTYDAAGNRTSVETASGTTRYAYDAMNRVASVTDADGNTTTYAYDARGQRTQRSYPNATRAEYTYDSLGRLTRLENLRADGSVINSYHYILGATGRRLAVVEADGERRDYDYDALYRLTRERVTKPSGATRTTEYTHDRVGNRLTRRIDGALTTYAYDGDDRLQSAGPITYDYDAQGNTVRKTTPAGITTYRYDSEQRLTEADTPSALVRYEHDHHGNRSARIENGARTEFVIDTNRRYAETVETRSAGGNLIARYAHADELLSQRRAATRHYHHHDGLGSTRALTDDTASERATYDYTPFGRLKEETGDIDNRHRFTGEYHDPALGQYYLRARYYAPAVARFSQMDTWQGRTSQPITLNKYAYGNADPVNHIDPSGNVSLAQVTTGTTIAGLLSTTAFLAYDYSTVGKFHQYKTRSRVCIGDGTPEDACRKSTAFEGLKRFPAPFYSGLAPVRDKHEKTLPLFGPIRHRVLEQSSTVRNITLEGHILHPGTVTRSVEDIGSSVFVITHGEGYGRFPLVNTWFDDVLWGGVDRNIQSYIGRQ